VRVCDAKLVGLAAHIDADTKVVSIRVPPYK